MKALKNFLKVEMIKGLIEAGEHQSIVDLLDKQESELTTTKEALKEAQDKLEKAMNMILDYDFGMIYSTKEDVLDKLEEGL